MAPPLTLTLSRSSPSSFSTARYCAGERLVDLDEIEVAERKPGLLAALCCVAGAGPIPISDGSTPTVAQWVSRPIGASPCSFTPRSDASRIAAAPSTMPDALPAVTQPFLLNAAGNFARPSIDESGRM